jgi:hypothetical protein
MRTPTLVPAQVPWQISPSAARLRVLLAESQKDAPALVEFAGYLGSHVQGSAPSASPAAGAGGALPPFQEGKFQVTAAYHLVRVAFSRGYWVRYAPALSESRVIDEADYDWTEVAGRMLPGERAHESVERARRVWGQTGVCPNPRMYEVRGSLWLESLGLHAQPQWRHYLLLGNDAYVEIVAAAWAWHLGQPLPGW